MNIRILCTLALAAALTATAGTSRFAHKAKAGHRAPVTAAKAPLSREGAALWRPLSVVNSYFFDDEWLQGEKIQYQYNPMGLPVLSVQEDEGSFIKTTTEYDELGREILETSSASEDGQAYVNSQKTSQAYDTRITDLIVEHLQWNWSAGQWNQNGNNYRRTVVRDAAGNVQSIVVETYGAGEWLENQKFEVTYGADGKAARIVTYVMDFYGSGQWQEGSVLSDIVWENTDGQICDNTNFYYGANRIRSARTADEQTDAQISVVYDGVNYVVTETGTVQGMEDVVHTVAVNYTGTEGSYNLTETFRLTEEDGSVYTESYYDEEQYDAWNLQLLALSTVTSGYGDDLETEIIDMMQGEAVYDATYGYPTEYILSLALIDEEDLVADGETLVPMVKTVFSDYVDAAGAGVDAIATQSDMTPRYYTLSGMELKTKPGTPGVYIERCGAKVRKTVIR